MSCRRLNVEVTKNSDFVTNSWPRWASEYFRTASSSSVCTILLRMRMLNGNTGVPQNSMDWQNSICRYNTGRKVMICNWIPKNSTVSIDCYVVDFDSGDSSVSRKGGWEWLLKGPKSHYRRYKSGSKVYRIMLLISSFFNSLVFSGEGWKVL